MARPVLHSTFDIQMEEIDIDNMSSVYIYLPLRSPQSSKSDMILPNIILKALKV